VSVARLEGVRNGLDRTRSIGLAVATSALVRFVRFIWQRTKEKFGAYLALDQVVLE
jgi:hypothetical protein